MEGERIGNREAVKQRTKRPGKGGRQRLSSDTGTEHPFLIPPCIRSILVYIVHNLALT